MKGGKGLQLYVLDRSKNTLATTADFYNDTHIKTVTAGASTFEFDINKTDDAAQYMDTGKYIVFQDDEGRPWSFDILSYEEHQTYKTVYCEDAGIGLINKNMDAWDTDQAYSFEYYFNLITANTPWKLGVNQLAGLSRKLTYTGRDTGLGRLLSILTGFDKAECQFNIKVQQNQPVEFTVDVYKTIGTIQDNIQIVYGNELNDIKKTESRAEFVTAVQGVGGVITPPEGTEVDPNAPEVKVDFKDLEYKDDNLETTKGDPFLRAVKANKLFNPGDQGYIESYYEYDTQSNTELLNRTITQLNTYSEPQYTYEADVQVIDPTLDIGDTVTIIDHDYNPALYLRARVATLEKSYRDPSKGSITFTNYELLNSSLAGKLRDLQSIINIMPSNSTIQIINSNLSLLAQAQKEAAEKLQVMMESADGKNSLYYNYRPANAKDGDTAFIKNADGETEIWVYKDDGGWQLDIGVATKEDVQKTAADATTQTTQAIATANSAVAVAESNATQVGNLENLTSQAANLATTAIGQAGDAAASAAGAMNSAQNALDKYANLQIGGRNYLLNTGTTFTYAGSPSNQIIGHMDVEQLNLLRGKDVVFSFYANAINAKGATGQSHRIVVEGKIYFTDGTTRYMTITKSIAVGESFTGRIIQPMTMTDKVASAGVDFRGYFQDNYDSAYMDQWQLELGNVATDYSQAPEDVQVQITNLNGELSQKVSQSTYDTLAGRVTTNETLATQNKNAITFKADKTDVDTINKTVSQQSASLTTIAGQISGLTTNTTTIDGKLTTLQGQFDLSSDKLATTMSKVDNMQIGGTNLAPGTNSDWITYTGHGYGTSLVTSPIYEIVDGETYTAQIEVRNTTYGVNLEFYAMNSKGSRIGAIITSVKQVVSIDGLMKVTFKASLPAGFAYLAPDLCFNGNLTDTNSYEYRRFKLEKGNIATDWSPSPEDQVTQTQLTSVIQDSQKWQVMAQANQTDIASLKLTATSMQTTLANAATQNQLTATANQLTSQISGLQDSDKKTSSLITQLQGMVDLRVTYGDVINSINISKESIVIAGNKVHITGTTTIDDGIINNAMIADATINGAKIADASILNAKIANLDGSKIAANSITADKLSTGSLIVAMNDSFSTIKMTPDAIQFYTTSQTIPTMTMNGIGLTFGDIITGETLATVWGAPYGDEADKTWYNGVTMQLPYNGGDYVALANGTSATSAATNTSVVWSVRDMAIYNIFKGFNFYDHVHFNTIGPFDGDVNARLKVVRAQVGGRWATGFYNSNTNVPNQSGVLFTDDGATYFGRAGKWYNLFDIVNKIGIA